MHEVPEDQNAQSTDSNSAQPSDSDSHSPDADSNRRLPVFVSAVAFFVSYVLSAGPAVFITRRFEQPFVTTIIECLYAPLIVIVKLRVPLVSPAIQAYVELFR